MATEQLSSFLQALRRPSQGRYAEDSLRYVLVLVVVLEVCFVVTFLANSVKCTPPNVGHFNARMGTNITVAELPALDFVELRCASFVALRRYVFAGATAALFLVYSVFVFSRTSGYLGQLSSAIRRRVVHEEMEIQAAAEAAAAAAAGAVESMGGGAALYSSHNNLRRRAASSSASLRDMDDGPGGAGNGNGNNGGESVAQPLTQPLLSPTMGGGGGDSWSQMDEPDVVGDLEADINEVIDRFRRFKIVAILVYLFLGSMASVEVTLFSQQESLASFSCETARFSGLNGDYPPLVYTCASAVTNWSAFLTFITVIVQFVVLCLLVTTYRSLKRYGKDREWEALVPKADADAMDGGAYPLHRMGGGVHKHGGYQPPSTDAASVLYGAVSGFLGGGGGGGGGGAGGYGRTAPYGALGSGVRAGATAGVGSNAGLGSLPGGNLISQQVSAVSDAVGSLTELMEQLKSLGDPELLASMASLSHQKLVLAGIGASFSSGFIAGLEAMCAMMRERGVSGDEAVFLAVLEAKLDAAQAGEAGTGGAGDGDVAAAVAAGVDAIVKKA